MHKRILARGPARHEGDAKVPRTGGNWSNKVRRRALSSEISYTTRNCGESPGKSAYRTSSSHGFLLGRFYFSDKAVDQELTSRERIRRTSRFHGCKILHSSPGLFDTSIQEIGNGQKKFGPI